MGKVPPRAIARPYSRGRYHDRMATGAIVAIFAYAGLGLLLALPMALRGVDRLDPAAAQGTWGFRLLALPGLIALWPLVLVRWLRARRP